MSTYYIADAIEKLANNFKEVMDEKNRIEREKLEFEKEKFKYMVEPIKIELPDPNNCDHNWVLEYSSLFPSDDGIPYYINKYVCSKCHESKKEKLKT